MNMPKILSVFAAIALLSACGSQVSKDGTTLVSGSASSSGVQAGSVGNTSNLPLAPESVAKISGAGGSNPTYTAWIDTSRTLKVKVTPLSAPNLTIPSYGNWVFAYGCVRLQVSANGTTQTTQILRVDGSSQSGSSVCQNAPTSQVLDFSNAVTGYTRVNVTISNPEYDNCRYAWPLTYGCGMSAIFATHLVAASIAVQGDGYWLNP